MRFQPVLLACLLLAACGLGETAGAAATAAALKAEEARVAKENQEKLTRQMGEAVQQGEQRLLAAEKD